MNASAALAVVVLAGISASLASLAINLSVPRLSRRRLEEQVALLAITGPLLSLTCNERDRT